MSKFPLFKLKEIGLTLVLIPCFYQGFTQNGVGVNTNTPKSSFEDNGSFGKKVTTITATTTLDDTYSTVVCNNGAAAITVTLPVANTCSARIYEIKRNAASTATVTVNVTSAGTIDGAASYLLTKAGQSISVFSDGSVWLLRDGNGVGDNWTLTGNSGTNVATNFLGTTDATALQFKTNNANAMRILSNGNVGIGTTGPTQKLQVDGNVLVNGVGNDLIVDGVSKLSSNASALKNYGVGSYVGYNQSALPAGGLGMTNFINFHFVGIGGFSWHNTNDMTTYQDMMVLRNASGSPRLGVNTSAPSSTMEVIGSTGKNVTVTTTSLTLDVTHSSIVCDNGASNITVTLPGPGACQYRIYEIKRKVAAANTGTVTIAGNIDGTVNYVLANPGQSVTVFSDGTNWHKRDGGNGAIDWSTTGNAGTTAGTNFLGTTDAQDFVTRTNNVERMRVLSGGNVGIGTTAPGAVLEVQKSSGTAIFVSSGNVANNTDFAIGRAGQEARLGMAAGGFQYSNSAVAGDIVLRVDNSANKVHVSAGSGIAQLTVTNTGVGIGLNAPQQNLSVLNGMNIDQGNTNSGTITNALTFGTISGEGIGSNRVGGNILGLDFYTLSNIRMSITNLGNVGINTTAPSSLLHVRQNSSGVATMPVIIQNGIPGNPINTEVVLRLSPSSSETVRGADLSAINNGGNAIDLRFLTSNAAAPAERMRITAGGNVGIGTTVPGYPLDVDIAATNVGKFGNSLSTYIIASNPGIGFNTYWGGANWSFGKGSVAGTHYASNIAFGTTTGAMGFRISNATGVANSAATMVTPLELTRTGVGIFCGSPNYALQVNGNVGVLGTIIASGTITASTAVTACSDIRYKKDIVPLSHSLENILRVKGVNYFWKINEFPDKRFTSDKQIGFIAQELEKIYPELVHTDKEGYKTVDYSRLTPILVEALKEQQKDIEVLKLETNAKFLEKSNEIDLLKKELEILKSAIITDVSAKNLK